MGTRSLTYVYDSEANDVSTPLLCLYRQYDGYPTGHGFELAEFLSSLTLVNGLGRDAKNVANGMGCLAGLLVCELKQGKAGDFYIYAPIVGQDAGHDYEYHVFQDSVSVYEGNIRDGNRLFKGTWEEFKSFCSEGE